jgi:hypothetical protein
MNNQLTNEQKIQLYREGRYTFPPPPVPHIHWGESSWIRYIDVYGRWLTK